MPPPDPKPKQKEKPAKHNHVHKQEPEGKNEKLEKMWEEFKKDETYYELSERSDDSDNDIDENYDSVYFKEVEIAARDDSGARSVHGKRLLTRTKKCIAKWAESRETVDRLVQLQNERMSPDRIFGPLSTDTVSLGEIFGPKYNYDFRGSSANWKNEYWTPLAPADDRTYARLNRQKDGKCQENLEKKFTLSQEFPALSEEAAGEDVDPPAESTEDFMRLQLPTSWQENKE